MTYDLIVMKNIRQLWFTANIIFRWPDRGFNYLLQRAGDSNLYLLIFIFCLTNSVTSAITDKDGLNLSKTILSLLFLLPLSFLGTLLFIKLSSSLYHYISNRFGGDGDAFIANQLVGGTIGTIPFAGGVLSTIYDLSGGDDYLADQIKELIKKYYK
jgi:hypothetical protein